MKRPRLLHHALILALVLALTLASSPPVAANGKPLPPGWSDWPEETYDAWEAGVYPHGGGGPTLTLLYLDVDALNETIARQGPDWEAPSFTPGQPMLLWGGMGFGGADSFRAGGGGAGGELRKESGDGISSLSLGYGAVQFHYVLRPGVDLKEAAASVFEPYPAGRFRLTVGGQVGFGGYQLRLTDNERPTEDFPIHREASEIFVLLAPELGVEFSLTPFTTLRLSASYFYPVTFNTHQPDPYIYPDPTIFQNLAVSVGLFFGVF